MEWVLHRPRSGESAPVVLIVHGFKGFMDWGFFPHLAVSLASAGLAALRFNLSHAGVGLGDDRQDFTRLDLFSRNRMSYEVADVRTMLDAVRSGDVLPAGAVDASRIGIVGHSRGGASSLIAGKDANVRAVVTWASVATTSFGETAAADFEAKGKWEVLNGRTGQLMMIERAAWEDVHPMPEALDLNVQTRRFADELLLLHGADDAAVPVEAARTLHELTDGRAKLEILPGADHVMNCRHPWAGSTPEFETACRLTAEHLVSRLT